MRKMSSILLVCRLCAEGKPTEKLFDLTINSEMYQEVLDKLLFVNATYVDLNNTNLPKTICLICSESLDKAFNFLNQVKIAQTIIEKSKTANSEVKEEVVEEIVNSGYKLVKDETANVRSELYVKDEDELALADIKKELNNDDAFSDYIHHDDLLNHEPPVKKRKKRKKLISEDGSRNIKLGKRPNRGILLSPSIDIPDDIKNLYWQGYPWSCDACNQEFKDINDLRSHSIAMHNKCYPYQCFDCDSRHKSYDIFIKHVRKHRKYLKKSCFLCFQNFSDAHTASKHFKTHNLMLVCEECGVSFNTIDKLLEHQFKYNKVIRRRRCDDGQPLQCSECSKSFKSKGNLLVHLKIHTERKRNYICHVCGKNFYNKGTLTSHMNLHESVRRFKCEICAAAFKTCTQLRSHVGIHGGPRPYSCAQCGRSFRLRTHLKSHLIIHTDAMPHTCEVCGRQFRFKTILTQHLRQHTGAKPYSCEMCARHFTNWPNYNKHMKRRHGLDMSKKKHTPTGVVPVNPLTGQLLELAKTSETEEWVKKIMVNKKPGRPKLSSDAPELARVDNAS